MSLSRLPFVLGAFLVTACAAPVGEDRASSDSNLSAKGESTELTGADIVRGVLGVKRDGSPKSSKGKMYAKAADAVIDDIEQRFPGRLTNIEKGLRSRDQKRVQEAKALLDETISAATSNPKLVARLKDDSAGNVATASLDGLHPLSNPSGSTDVMDECPGPGPDTATLGQADGRYGDDRTGFSGAVGDTTDLVDTTDLLIWRTLQSVDDGELTPDPESRLGAYAATRGYPPGSVGDAVHNAIGTIYLTFANYGQENIGRVFNSPQAKALYPKPVTSCAGKLMATLEHRYWSNVAEEDPWSPGGQMGSMFSPDVRDLLQVHVFGSDAEE